MKGYIVGYSTDFDGALELSKEPSESLVSNINEFSDERHTEPEFPGFYCQWIIEDGELVWDGDEKFYNYTKWLEYLIEHFFEPNGIKLNGTIYWQGEEPGDTGRIIVKDSVVREVSGHSYSHIIDKVLAILSVDPIIKLSQSTKKKLDDLRND